MSAFAIGPSRPGSHGCNIGRIGVLAAHAQAGAPPVRIGIVWAAGATRLAAFTQRLRDNGRIEGRYYIVDVSHARGDNERFPALVKDLLHRAPAVIMTKTFVATCAVQLATRTVPIVMIAASDPVANGLVASMAQPVRQHHRAIEPE